jgi:hypothetical protein
MRVKRVGFLSLIVILAVARQAGAQDPPQPQEIRFVSNEQSLANVQVSGFLNGVNKGIRRTGSDGTITIPASALNTVTKGTSIAVWVVTCRGGVITEVMVIREEDGNPNRHEPEHIGEDCRCDRKAVFIWGRGPVTIDVSTGEVSYGDGDADGGGVSGYVSPFGIGQYTPEVDYDSGNTAKSGWGFGGGAYAGLKLTEHLWGGVNGHIKNVSRDFVRDGETGDVDYNEYSIVLNGRYLFGDGNFNPYIELGGGYERETGDNDAKHESAIWQIGLGGVFWTGERLGWDVKLVFRPAVENDDAGQYYGLTFGPIINLGMPCGGSCGRGEGRSR